MVLTFWDKPGATDKSFQTKTWGRELHICSSNAYENENQFNYNTAMKISEYKDKQQGGSIKENNSQLNCTANERTVVILVGEINEKNYNISALWQRAYAKKWEYVQLLV